MEEWEVINNLACMKENMKQRDDLAKETVIETINAAITGLKEVQQYRAIGTVEECRKAMENQRKKKGEVI